MVKSIANILKYLEKKKIYLDRKEFAFQINSHPAFPSLLSIVSALNVNKIYNYVLDIEGSEIDELPDDFIAFIVLSDNEPELAYIERVNEKYLINGKFKINGKELMLKWNNIVILIDETNSILDSNNEIKKTSFKILFVSILILLIYIYYNINLNPFMFLVLSMCGFVLSILSLKKEFGIENTIVNKICSGVYTDCSFDETKKTKFISRFADCSLAYFFTNIISLLFLSNGKNIEVFFMVQKLLMVFIFPIISYSLFYQFFKIKKICPLCIMIIIVLMLQTYISYRM